MAAIERGAKRAATGRPGGPAGLRSALMPKGLYARSILIVVMPIVLLQGVVAYVFMERHWQTVTQRLSGALSRDIAALIEVMETYPHEQRFADVVRLADTLGLTVAVLPPGPLPPAAPRPFFDLLDRTLSRELLQRIGRPFWIDTVGNSDLVEIRVRSEDSTLQVFARRSRAYASNSHIFLVWMAGTSLVVVAIALLFLRNQIVPILLLARAAEAFGKGRPAQAFRPRGAREVRQAAQAFLDMRERIERQIEQRTTMLSGVSHDLRTVLTRFRLELELLPESDDTLAMRADVDEMSRMLEDYLAFARGDGGEESRSVSLPALIEEAVEPARRAGHIVGVAFEGTPEAQVRPIAVRRCLANLVGNAGRFARRIEVAARHADGWLTVTVDDDGPGIPVEERERVFRPFYRLDTARNADAGGSGLGLAIARDVARGHGGDITLAESPLGGLRATVALPA